MRVLYDHQAFTVQNVGGVSRYHRALLDYAAPDQQSEISLALSNNLYLQDRRYSQHRPFFPNLNFRGRFRLMCLINKENSRRILRRGQFDIFHPTLCDETYFLSELQDKSLVITIHDMIALLFPEQFPDSKGIRQIVARANHIITVSDNTRADVLRLLQVEPERVTTIHHGFTPTVAGHSGVDPGYILFVGTRQGYKNFDCILDALALLRRESATATLRLVCAGGGPATAPEIMRLRELSLGQAVQFMGTVTEEVLGGLYHGAAAFVFPSRYEGFGLPILEAFGQRCPVVLSRASCFPEIAQEAALYFDPDHPADLAAQVSQLLRDSSQRRALMKQGTLRLRDFTWEKTANCTRDVYLAAREQYVFS